MDLCLNCKIKPRLPCLNYQNHPLKTRNTI